MTQEDLRTLAAAYFAAFGTRDLESCLAFFSDDSSLTFHTGDYKGINAIEDWHKDRFKADLRVIDMGAMEVQESTVSLEVVVSSKRLRAWRVNELTGNVSLCFDGGKIVQATFGLGSK